ncbi:hypothetical protein [Acetobacterium wieringae]|uniref:hypothetical protein n=1 Tax=Acetobacterium wieringae TaxID=52694 RepID=UPI0026ECC72A|nr:hypothetical protein [Acetobacterium wieringae]
MKLTKKFVEVVVRFDGNGIIPLEIHWPDGRVFEIDRVLDVRQAASVAVGGIGIRYKCKIGGKERLLFYEEPRWFVEAKSPGV